VSKSPKSVADLYAEHESLRELAKILYDEADLTLKKLVTVWSKDKRANIGEHDLTKFSAELRKLVRSLKSQAAKVDEGHSLEIEDQFRAATKAFAPGFAHRYKLKPRKIEVE